MDAAIQSIFTALEAPRRRSLAQIDGIAENTIVIVNGDHGETLHEHECYFDHHWGGRRPL